MKPKTQEFLNFLLWKSDQWTRPKVWKFLESYETWAYRNGLLRQAATLEEQGFIERSSKTPEDRLYRLTQRGRLQALGGRDPQVQWARRWDGRWRLVLFDVPREHNTRRARLRRYLRSKAFGCLQGSVWISPDPLLVERRILGDGAINVKSLILLDAVPRAGESDSQIVAGAWDFEQINQRYSRHMDVLEQRPRASLQDRAAAKALQRWAGAERQEWLEAVSSDPLLPERLLPQGYLGRRAWQRRSEVLADAGRQLATFDS